MNNQGQDKQYRLIRESEGKPSGRLYITSETDQIEALKAENFYLKSLLKASEDEYPRDFHLTSTEQRLLTHLREARSVATLDQLCESVGCKRKVLTVHLCWLRKKLSSIDVSIDSIWGEGYRIDAKNRKRINEAIFNREILPTRYMMEQERKLARIA